MQRPLQSIWPHLALLIAAEVNENGRKRRRHPRDWHRLARLVKDLDKRTKPLMEAMMMVMTGPPRGLHRGALVVFTGCFNDGPAKPLRGKVMRVAAIVPPDPDGFVRKSFGVVLSARKGVIYDASCVRLATADEINAPDRWRFYEASSWTGREEGQASLRLLDRLRLRLKDFVASLVLGRSPWVWYFRHGTDMRFREPLCLGVSYNDRRLRARIVHAIIRAVPTCTLWRFDPCDWFYRFRPWPHLIVAPESIEDAPKPRRRAK